MLGLLSRLFDSGSRTTRAEATRLGLSVSMVRRDVPHFTRGNASFILEPASCVRYSLPRQPGRRPAHWSFLQRTPKLGAQYPNGWLYASDDGDPPETLRRVLEKIALEWTEELLEFEASAEEVSAFWEEWGGPDMASQLSRYLRELADV